MRSAFIQALFGKIILSLAPLTFFLLCMGLVKWRSSFKSELGIISAAKWNFTPPLPTTTKKDHNNPVFKVSLTAKTVNVNLCQVTKFSLYLSVLTVLYFYKNGFTLFLNCFRLFTYAKFLFSEIFIFSLAVYRFP